MKIMPFLLTDWYKIGHPFQYPDGTQYVSSNLTPRASRLEGVEKMALFGLQMFIKKYLVKYFQENFFDQPKEEVVAQYKRRIVTSLGADLPSYKHIEDLHDLGYLPIRIKALKEGSRVNMKVPVLTIVNTLPEYYWLTNFFETLTSCEIWQPCTSATIAYEYRKIFDDYAKRTGMPPEFVPFQGHDFSFRGMSSLESAISSGMGHLLSGVGTDTIPAIEALEFYYNADADKELVGASVPATEHSVMSSGIGMYGEFETFKKLITEDYPTGIISLVSDTMNLWEVLTDFMPRLKDEILARDGKVVIRPDSGDPADIICGDPKAEPGSPEYKGVVSLLWETFGGTFTDTKHRLLNEHIGAIYGDSITRDRAQNILQRLMDKGFASQVVFGVGSFTYQYNTRDTFSTAVKSTNVVINGNSIPIFKDPVTDNGMKKSARGLLRVDLEGGEYVLRDNVTPEEEAGGALEVVYEDGKLLRDESLADIRNTLHPQPVTV